MCTETDCNVTRVTFFSPLQEKPPVHLRIEALPDTWASSTSGIRFFTFLIVVNIFVGNLFSVLVFRIAFRRSRTTAINLMICVDQGFKMVGNTWTVSVIAAVANLMWSSSPPLVTYTGLPFCQVSYFVGCLTMISNLVVGAGIALVRLLFIKYPKVIQGAELKYSILIIMACIAITTAASYAFSVYPKRNQVLTDVCLGRSREMNFVLFDYVVGNNELGILHNLVRVGFAFVVAEIIMYVQICNFIYNHDQSMKSMLPDSTVKKRNSRNALDLFGHMLSFFIDNIFLGLCSIDIRSLNAGDFSKAVLYALALSGYGIYSFCQILLSRSLKVELLKFLDSLLMLPLLSKILEFFGYIGLIKSRHVSSIRNVRNNYLSHH